MLKTDAPASLRERVKRDKLKRIEAAARKLFAKKGYEATTTRAIADAAGVGIGTVFVYFPEKLDLLIRLYSQDLEETVMRAFDALPPGSGLVEACFRVISTIFAFFERDPDLARSFVKELMFIDGERERSLFQARMGFIARLQELVAAGQARGELHPKLSPPAVAFQLFGIYYWCLISWLRGPPFTAEVRDAALRSSLKNLVRGLSAGGKA